MGEKKQDHTSTLSMSMGRYGSGQQQQQRRRSSNFSGSLSLSSGAFSTDESGLRITNTAGTDELKKERDEYKRKWIKTRELLRRHGLRDASSRPLSPQPRSGENDVEGQGADVVHASQRINRVASLANDEETDGEEEIHFTNEEEIDNEEENRFTSDEESNEEEEVDLNDGEVRGDV